MCLVCAWFGYGLKVGAGCSQLEDISEQVGAGLVPVLCLFRACCVRGWYVGWFGGEEGCEHSQLRASASRREGCALLLATACQGIVPQNSQHARPCPQRWRLPRAAPCAAGGGRRGACNEARMKKAMKCRPYWPARGGGRQGGSESALNYPLYCALPTL